MTLALDTNVFIDLMRGRQSLVRERHAAALSGGRALVASLIVFHELHFGIAASPNRQPRRTLLRSFYKVFPSWP